MARQEADVFQIKCALFDEDEIGRGRTPVLHALRKGFGWPFSRGLKTFLGQPC
jgi:hypothetical protein